jgi:type I restriction enzyme S subunit
MPDIGNIPLLVGPLREQRQRAQALKQRLAKIDMLGEHVQLHVERLREYRSSLISAAVTGQLDVGAPAEPARLVA